MVESHWIRGGASQERGMGGEHRNEKDKSGSGREKGEASECLACARKDLSQACRPEATM